MYVSVTGLETKNILGTIRFWLLTVPAFREALDAEGIMFCENKTRNGCHHTLTVWETKKHMMVYRKSPRHLKAMKAFSSFATGKVHGYESDRVPSWEEALIEYDQHARPV